MAHDGTQPPARSDALVVFGATGDLAHKKVLPALYALHLRGDLNVPVIGVASSPWSHDEFRERARTSVQASGAAAACSELDSFLAQLQYVSGN